MPAITAAWALAVNFCPAEALGERSSARPEPDLHSCVPRGRLPRGRQKHNPWV